MPKIFLSYRRGDSQDVTGRIFDRLVAHCGKLNVFKDVDSIPPGVDFRKVLGQEVGRCDIVVAVIGEQWVLAKDQAGQRRIDHSGDFVRIEIESALARGIPVIPVLVGSAEMPDEAELPTSIGPLAYRHAVRVRPDPDFHRDVDRLCVGISGHATLATSGSPASPLELAPSTGATEAVPSPTTSGLEQSACAARSAAPRPTEVDASVTEAELTAAKAAIAVTVVDGVTFRRLHGVCGARTVPALVAALNEAIDDASRISALRLIGFAVRHPESRQFISIGLQAAIDYGVLHSWHPQLHTAGLEAVVATPLPVRDKWQHLMAALPLASEAGLPGIIDRLATITPPTERHTTGDAVLNTLRFASREQTVSSACRTILALGYRAAIPTLTEILATMNPEFFHHVAATLAQWRVVDAVPGIRDAIERSRYGPDGWKLGSLLQSLFALEGSQCSGYLADVVRSSPSTAQLQLLNQLSNLSTLDEVVVDAIRDVARDSSDDRAREKATELLRKIQSRPGPP